MKNREEGSAPAIEDREEGQKLGHRYKTHSGVYDLSILAINVIDLTMG
jgi:hypothetical protein